MCAWISAFRLLPRLFVGLALLVRCSYAEGRDSPTSQRVFPALLETWRSDDGLPNNAVTSLLQTRDGYLWIGTSNGLARFDGVRFVTYRTLDTPELRSNHILTLYEDRHRALWIGTDDGLIRFEHGQFSALTTRDGLSSEAVLCMNEDHEGRLWVGTQSGLNRSEPARFVSFFRIDGLPDDRVNAIGSRRNGSLFFGTGQGLAELSSGQPRAYRPRTDLPLLNVRAVLEDHTGALWLASEDGLWRVPPSVAGEKVSQICPTGVLAVVERSSRKIWFGTVSGALCRVTDRGPEKTVQEVIRMPAAITALCEDREGNLWIGTAGEGLRRLRRRQLHLLHFPDDGIQQDAPSMLETEGGSVWLASAMGGLQIWTHGTWQRWRNPDFPESALVRALAGDPASRLWIGTLGDGLYCWSLGEMRRWSERDGLSDSAIETLCADGQGGVWIGTRNGGLNHLRAGRLQRLNTPWGFTGHYASVIALGPDGTPWIGTTGDGLFHWANGAFTVYTSRRGLPSDVVQALLSDEDGVLWVGTTAGLARIKDGELHAYTAKDGLPEDAISQLQDDGQGNLWVGSNHGLFRLRKKQMEAGADGDTRPLDAVTYGKSDGVADLQCLPGGRVTSLHKQSPRVWFLSSRGLVWADSDDLSWNVLAPPVLLEQVRVENEAVPLSDPIYVRPGKENLQFQYTALSLTAPEKVRFRCRLDGFDRDWGETGSSRVTRYPKLPPGRYRFQVRACNNDGVWNETGASVGLIVAPFWWQTRWFQLATVAVLAGLVIGLVQLRRARRREIEKLRLRIAGDLHDEIGSSVWSITLLSQMLHKYGAMGEEERRDVGEIHRIATQTANAVRDIVWLINPAFDTVQDLVMRMNDFAATMLRGVSVQLQSERADLSRQLPLDFRQNIFLIYKETITNIAKHAHATRVEVVIEEHDDLWQLCIRDNGVGFDPAASTSGNGLKNLRTRAEKLAGTLEVESTPGGGTTVVARVRLG